MLRDVVATFLNSLSEREFDAPLLAILSAQGFRDVNFIHGSFEFGKDVIAKRDDASGQTYQFAIQSKAGDIGLASWRDIRPQLDECEYNTRAHPGYDSKLPRVAILVTTGKLKGAAAPDAQEYGENIRSRGVAKFEVWDHQQLLEWLELDPTLGLAGSGQSSELLSLISSIDATSISEPELERFARRWLQGDGARRLPTAAIEAAVICHRLRQTQRLDLAAWTALFLLRAAWVDGAPTTEKEADTLRRSAIRLFSGYAKELLDQAEPLLNDSKKLAHDVFDPIAIVTYPATCMRLLELVSLLALCDEGVSERVRQRAISATVRLMEQHPGSTRPPSDLFASSLIPATIVASGCAHDSAVRFLRDVSNWLLDRHDRDKSGLGLASIDASPEEVAERLVGGRLDSTSLEPRGNSYAATVVLDLLMTLGARDLYEGVKQNLSALQIFPTISAAEENDAKWARGGDHVWPHPAVSYSDWDGPRPQHHFARFNVPDQDAILLGAACRSRHDLNSIRSMLATSQVP